MSFLLAASMYMSVEGLKSCLLFEITFTLFTQNAFHFQGIYKDDG